MVKLTTVKRRAHVIEVYPSEGKAAIKFRLRGKDRIECVPLHTDNNGGVLVVGQKGNAQYHITPSMGVWGFEPKTSNKD